MPSLAVPRKINDLAVLPVSLPSTPAYAHHPTHYLYLRPDAPQHASEELTPQNLKSLFVANIPVCASEDEFRILFKGVDSSALVDSVEFASEEKARVGLAVTGEVVVQGTKIGVPIGSVGGGSGRKRKRGRSTNGGEDEVVAKKLAEMEMPRVWGRGVWESGSAAVIRFVDRDACRAGWKGVLRAVKEGRTLQWPDAGSAEEGLGLQRYKTHASLTYPPHSLLHAKVNAYLSHFATLESLRAQHLARQRNIPDEEGFITVTRGGRTGAGRVEDAKAAQERLKERAEKRIGKDFYRFQTREEAKRREGDLRRRFEEERKRVEHMRGKRKVVPE